MRFLFLYVTSFKRIGLLNKFCSGLTSVIFKDTEGWSADGTSISSTALANAGTAADYLTEQYYDATWTKE